MKSDNSYYALKVLNKRKIFEAKQIKNAMIERNILALN